MQIFSIAIILLVLFSIPIVVERKLRRDIFSPTTISMTFLIITTIPYLISISQDHSILYPLVQSRFTESELTIAIVKFALVLVLGVAGLILGINSRIAPSIVKPLPILIGSESQVRYFWAFISSFLLGLLGYKLFMDSAGGFTYWINNLDQRASVTNGSGYMMVLMGLLEISVFIFICSFKYKKTVFKYLFLAALIIGVSFLLTSLGGRKPTLQFLVFCMIIWHFAVNNIKRLPFKMALLVPVALLYIIVMPIIRTSGGLEFYSSRPEMLMEEMVEDVGAVTQQFSYVDHYLFIMDYFEIEKIWLGSSYLDLFYAPIPSSIYPDKPPVDDGVYIRTLAEGGEVSPTTPFREMFQSSWPTETFGTLYMNFWIPGVFVGFFLLGIIYKAAYLYMLKSEYSLHSIIIYGSILLNFHLSNLRMVQTLSDIVFITVFLAVFFFGFKKRYRIVLKRSWQ